MHSVKVLLQDVLSKLQQSEGKGQKSILTIVDKNRATFLELFHLSGLDVDFTNHNFTIHGEDEQMVIWAKQRIVSMLQEPLFTVRINPKVIVGMRLLNDAKKHFSVETGCWLHFAWASHTICCYGLNGTAAGQYIHGILQNVDNCTARPEGVNGNIVTEDCYDRRLKPLIKKYVNFIESQTKAKLAVQKDDAEAKEIVVQFYGRREDIAKAQQMILCDLEDIQAKETLLKKTHGKSAPNVKELLKEHYKAISSASESCAIVLSCPDGDSMAGGQKVLVGPATSVYPVTPTLQPPGAWPQIRIERPQDSMSLAPPSLDPSRHPSIASSSSTYEGSLGPDSVASSLGRGDPRLLESLAGPALRRHTTTVLANGANLTAPAPRPRACSSSDPQPVYLVPSAAPSRSVSFDAAAGTPGPVPMSGSWNTPPMPPPAPHHTPGDLQTLLSALRCGAVPRPTPGAPFGSAFPTAAGPGGFGQRAPQRTDAIDRICHLVHTAGLSPNWFIDLLQQLEESQINVDDFVHFLELQADSPLAPLAGYPGGLMA